MQVILFLDGERADAIAEVAASRSQSVEEIVNTIVISWAENYIEQRRAEKVESFRGAGETLAMLPEDDREELLALLREKAEARGIAVPEQEQSGSE